MIDLKTKQYGANLTKSQHEAMLQLEKWYNSPSLIATLKGAAGTGKTYLLNIFLKNIANVATCVTAPTHKAVRIIEKSTGKKGRTIHSLHGLRPDVSLDNFNIDDVKFSSLGQSSLGNYKIIPCDECGMINNFLDDFNYTRAKQYNTKILYLGDEYQLPPVKQVISSTFTKYPTFELIEIVRQKENNPLLEPLLLLREDIKNNTSKFIYYLNSNRKDINSKGEGFEVMTRDKFQKSMMLDFSDDKFHNNLDYCRYIAYENDNIMSWNKVIRSKTNLLESTKVDIINEDDVFTSYKTIVDEYLNPIIINSEDYIVDDVRRYKNEYNMETFIVSFKNFYTNQVSRSVQVVDHNDDATLLIYYSKLKELLENAKYSHASERKQRWKEYYTFKESHLSMISFYIYSNDKEKLGYVEKDISYGFGITVHKSQGSTYENVYVNVLNINTMFNKRYITLKLRNQLLYVALSRASKKVNILL